MLTATSSDSTLYFIFLLHIYILAFTYLKGTKMVRSAHKLQEGRTQGLAHLSLAWAGRWAVSFLYTCGKRWPSGQPPPEVPAGALVCPDQQADTQPDAHAYAEADPDSNPHASIKP